MGLKETGELRQRSEAAGNEVLAGTCGARAFFPARPLATRVLVSNLGIRYQRELRHSLRPVTFGARTSVSLSDVSVPTDKGQDPKNDPYEFATTVPTSTQLAGLHGLCCNSACFTGLSATATADIPLCTASVPELSSERREVPRLPVSDPQRAFQTNHPSVDVFRGVTTVFCCRALQDRRDPEETEAPKESL